MDAYVVCGSRDWPAPWFVTAMIIELIPEGSLIITGGAKQRPGTPPCESGNSPLCSVDEWAEAEAIRLGYPTKVMPADWERLGKRAGIIRNLAMLDERPAAVLAFQYLRSRGTGHMALNTVKRGILLHHFTEADLEPDIAALDMGDVE